MALMDIVADLTRFKIWIDIFDITDHHLAGWVHTIPVYLVCNWYSTRNQTHDLTLVI